MPTSTPSEELEQISSPDVVSTSLQTEAVTTEAVTSDGEYETISMPNNEGEDTDEYQTTGASDEMSSSEMEAWMDEFKAVRGPKPRECRFSYPLEIDLDSEEGATKAKTPDAVVAKVASEDEENGVAHNTNDESDPINKEEWMQIIKAESVSDPGKHWCSLLHT